MTDTVDVDDKLAYGVDMTTTETALACTGPIPTLKNIWTSEQNDLVFVEVLGNYAGFYRHHLFAWMPSGYLGHVSS